MLAVEPIARAGMGALVGAGAAEAEAVATAPVAVHSPPRLNRGPEAEEREELRAAALATEVLTAAAGARRGAAGAQGEAAAGAPRPPRKTPGTGPAPAPAPPPGTLAALCRRLQHLKTMPPPLLLLRFCPLNLLPRLMRCGLRLRVRFPLRHRSPHLALRRSPRHHRRLLRPEPAGQQLLGPRRDLDLKPPRLRVGARVGPGDLPQQQQEQHLQQEDKRRQAGEEHQQKKGKKQGQGK